jgi:hypothetical protein
LLQHGGTERWPVSDLLRLLKNLRQRVRDHDLAWDPLSPVFSGPWLSDQFGDVDAIATTGQSGAMNDGLALELFDLEFVLQCAQMGEAEPVRLLLPWALLIAAVRAEDVSRSARIEMIQVAFTMMWAQWHGMPETGATKGIAQRKTRDGAGNVLPMTLMTRQQAKRGINLCIALFLTLDTIEGGVALGRLGSHACETHFGQIRAIIRGQTQVRLWNRAEAAVSLMGEFLNDLGLRAPARLGRVSASGVSVPEVDEIDEVQDGWARDDETLAVLLANAREFAIRAQVQFKGPLREYRRPRRVAEGEGAQGAAKLSHPSPMAGCAADARRKVGAGKF